MSVPTERRDARLSPPNAGTAQITRLNKAVLEILVDEDICPPEHYANILSLSASANMTSFSKTQTRKPFSSSPTGPGQEDQAFRTHHEKFPAVSFIFKYFNGTVRLVRRLQLLG